jgi:hypothetical protein
MLVIADADVAAAIDKKAERERGYGVRMENGGSRVSKSKRRTSVGDDI